MDEIGWLFRIGTTFRDHNLWAIRLPEERFRRTKSGYLIGRFAEQSVYPVFKRGRDVQRWGKWSAYASRGRHWNDEINLKLELDFWQKPG